MKRIVMCDDTCYLITGEDYAALKRISPGLARLAKDSDADSPTHFVCELCGQIAPLKLRKLHKCR